MQTNSSERHFFLILLGIAFVLGAIILWPFLRVIVLSAALSVVLYPIYRWLSKHITRGNTWLASLITVIFFIIILCGPIFLIGSAVFHQSQNLYYSIAENGNASTLLSKVGTTFDKYLPEGISADLQSRAADLIAGLTNSLGTIFATTLTTIFSLLLIILSMFYFLKDGRTWRETVMQLSPLSDKNHERIFSKLTHAINGVVKGYLLIALIQGILMGIGLAMFGVPNPALWGVLTGVASLIPTIGTALVSIPAVIYLFSIGHTGSAAGLLIWAILAVGTIDNFLSPVFVGRQVSVHPLLILFSVLGGIALMGPIGILVGPLAISFLYALISIYRSEFTQVENSATGVRV